MANYNIAPTYGTVVYADATVGTAANLIDGLPINQAAVALGEDYYTEYRTDGLPAYVIIDLGASREITGCALWGSARLNGWCVKDYRIALSNTVSGSFANVVVDSQIRFETYYFHGRLIVERDYQPITPQSARYVKLFLDSNHGRAGAVATMELEILGPAVQQDTKSVYSDAEVYEPSGSTTVLSDAYIIPPIVYTGIASVLSNAEVTDKRRDVLSDAYVADAVYSDATILGNEEITVTSDAMVYRSITQSYKTFLMGRGSSVGFPEARDLLVYCTNFSSSDGTIVPDTVTSSTTPGSVLDMTEVTPPLGYDNYAWKYDWVVRTYNAAQYKFEIRTGETIPDLTANTFSPITLGQVIPIGSVPRYYQWRCHVWASGSGDFELHQFSIKGYVDHHESLLYSSLNETGIDKPYEPMDMTDIWGGSYVPGDADGDGIIEYPDLTYMVAYMFADGPAPDPVRRIELNDDGSTDIADLLYFIAYFVSNGPPPYRWDEGGLE